ncbi:MAG TPA: HD domain-containing phosphohydrolase [Terriglobales bacterium]|nr:HD domain-containing phosphohydrolase [Terriglobales bacterium]
MASFSKARVLLVDDEPLVLEGLRRSVRAEFATDLAGGAEEGLAKLREGPPYPVVVSDMHMPGMDGAKFLATVRTISPDSVRVMLTGSSDMQAAASAVNEGQIFRFLTKPVTSETLLATLRACVVRYHDALLEKDQLKIAVEALEQLDLGTLTALARAIDAKSAWTAGHSERVTILALKIGHAMSLPAKSLEIMHRGGLLHDIGKIGTPLAVLDKPGALEPDEMQIMQDHVKIGVRILEPIPCFREALPMVAQHHEWLDGSGYPAGLAGENISLLARILAVADCYDAIVSDRPYRKGLPKQQALEILTQRSGTQFDPIIIEVFTRLNVAGHLA